MRGDEQRLGGTNYSSNHQEQRPTTTAFADRGSATLAEGDRNTVAEDEGALPSVNAEDEDRLTPNWIA